MLSGSLYDPRDPELSEERLKARLLIKALNDSGEDQSEERSRILKELLPHAGKGLWIQPPFYCDYGYNIKTGENVFFNFNCVVLDVMVTIGKMCLFAWTDLYCHSPDESQAESLVAGVRETGNNR